MRSRLISMILPAAMMAPTPLKSLAETNISKNEGAPSAEISRAINARLIWIEKLNGSFENEMGEITKLLVLRQKKNRYKRESVPLNLIAPFHVCAVKPLNGEGELLIAYLEALRQRQSALDFLYGAKNHLFIQESIAGFIPENLREGLINKNKEIKKALRDTRQHFAEKEKVFKEAAIRTNSFEILLLRHGLANGKLELPGVLTAERFATENCSFHLSFKKPFRDPL